jgi:hypothetical protein
LRVCSSAQVYPLRFVERTVLRRHLHLGAVQQPFDGEYLNAREVLPPSWGVVEARSNRFLPYGLGGSFEGDENADGGLLQMLPSRRPEDPGVASWP